MKLLNIYHQLLTESINLDDMKRVGKTFLKFQDSQIDDFIKWIDAFPVSGKSPRGMVKEFERIKSLKKYAEMYKDYKIVSSNISAAFSWLKEEDIDKMVDAFLGKGEKVEKLQLGNCTYFNNSAMAESRFKSTSEKITSFLNTLKGFHKKALIGNLEIHFKPSKDLRSKAVYKSNLDQIWIRESNAREVDTEVYASLLYIIVHELGHRFENKVRVPDMFQDRDFYTTKYSHTDSMAGSECFAEIFAISHFGESSYPQFKDKIDKFLELMK